jgi:pimeloyl-ACP methyl ester carboxylesterase
LAEIAALEERGGLRPGIERDAARFGDRRDGINILEGEAGIRGQGRSAAAAESTWRFDQFVQDVSALAKAMKLGQYAVLGHSYGAFVALQHAISFPGEAAQTIVSNGVPSTGFLWERVERSLAELQPPELRDQITESWEREKTAQTQEDVERL